MIKASDAENVPIHVLFEYFERALQEIGLAAGIGLLRPGNENAFREKISDRVFSNLSGYSEGESTSINQTDPYKHLRWEPWDEPEKEITAHYRLQSAIVAALMGERKGLMALSGLLITEPLNRKLEIGYFLGNLTDEKVGLAYKGIPTKEQIFKWVEKCKDVVLEDRLRDLSKLNLE